jgi:uroporphyrinogen decarboxylase
MDSNQVNQTRSGEEGSEKVLLRVLRRQGGGRIPLWLMRQAGRYLPEYREIRARVGGFLELCFDPVLAAEVTLQPVRRFELDAAILFSDILVVPYGLGQEVRFTEGEGPALERIGDERGLGSLNMESMIKRLEPVYEAVGRVVGKLPRTTALIGFAGGPWTVASYMVEGCGSRDFLTVKLSAYSQPSFFTRLLEILIEATASHLVQQVQAGAEVLQIFDSWAGVLGEAEFEAWCVEPIRRIVEKVKSSCPGVPIIGFPRGAGVGYARFVARTGVDGVSLDSMVPLSWAVNEISPRATLQGNLEPARLVAGGEVLREGTRRILEAWKDVPFVFNVGHGVLPTTPPEHVSVLAKLVHRGQP